VTLATRPALEQRRHPTMAEAALGAFYDSILSGEPAPGSALRLENLAARLGTSMSPAREAARRLENLGLVVHVPHRRAHVSRLALDDLRDTCSERLLFNGV
jgi:DNA-binding GntR family transcriptional regulator